MRPSAKGLNCRRASAAALLQPQSSAFSDGEHLSPCPHFRLRAIQVDFTQTLGELRAELGFKIIGYVLMPEHCHLLIWPSELADPSQIMQKLAERTANFILRTLRRNPDFPWCQTMLARFALPATVHHHAHCRVWQRGGYDMNICSEKKRLEKLNYMHNNPVKRRLVKEPGDWAWSSWRFYYRRDGSVLAMDRIP